MGIEYQAEELIAELRSDGQRMVDAYFRPHSDTDWLIDTSVEGNTFRGLPLPHQQPSRVFRGWAHNLLDHLSRIQDLGRIRSREEMDELVIQRSAHLAEHWLTETRKELPLGPRRKLVNLLHKSLLRADVIEADDRERVIPFLHVPHDEYCLAAVRLTAASDQIKPPMAIPRNAAYWASSLRKPNTPHSSSGCEPSPRKRACHPSPLICSHGTEIMAGCKTVGKAADFAVESLRRDDVKHPFGDSPCPPTFSNSSTCTAGKRTASLPKRSPSSAKTTPWRSLTSTPTFGTSKTQSRPSTRKTPGNPCWFSAQLRSPEAPSPAR